MNQDDAKRLVAGAALEQLPKAGVIGLGSGSTAKLFIDGVGELVRQGRRLKGVPTSEASRIQAEQLGIELLPDDGPWDIDLCVDGADEVSRDLDLIKGGGGCHTREKIVNQAAARNIIVVDESKLSERLGEKWPVPVEVLAFAHRATVAQIKPFGVVTLRLKNGEPWITDAGNFIYDLKVDPLTDPGELDLRLNTIPGVVQTGLFVGRCDLVLVAGDSGVRMLER